MAGVCEASSLAAGVQGARHLAVSVRHAPSRPVFGGRQAEASCSGRSSGTTIASHSHKLTASRSRQIARVSAPEAPQAPTAADDGNGDEQQQPAEDAAHSGGGTPPAAAAAPKVKLLGALELTSGPMSSLDDRITSGEFTDAGSTKEKMTRPMRRALGKDPLGPGRWLAYSLAKAGQQWRYEAALRMPEARGDIREIVGEPVFVPLYKLFLAYGPIFRLSFGPKSFVVVSDPAMTKQILLTNASKYSKGILSEILDFIMGTGLIPADGEIWRTRRRAIVPSLHKRYVASMVSMFGASTMHGLATLDAAAVSRQPVEMENYFSRLALDIIGKAVFNYDFDSLTTDDPVIKAVYTALREAEYRSTFPIPYWNLAPLRWLVPRQRQCTDALVIINETLDGLVDRCKQLVREEDAEFGDEFLSDADPSILHFLIASGEQISSKQLRDDLMTLLIAGHETTAAVLTWTLYCLSSHPEVVARMQAEVDEVLGDRLPGVEDMKRLRYVTRVLNESMRMYPQPPVLIRRALEDDVIGGYPVKAGSDIFVSVWNLHRSPNMWDRADEFDPDRFGPLDGPIPNEVTEDFKYLPFGGGKRKCIGDQFALFEAIVALSMLTRRYNFELATDCPPVGMTTGATIHTTNGLHMRVKRRDVSASHGSAAGASSQNAGAGGGCPHSKA